MQKYNINSILILFGFLLLLIGFFMNQKGTVDFQINETYLVVGKAQIVRTLGLLTILNGLVYALFDRLKINFNLRFKIFGIVLFFLSLAIIANGFVFFSESNGLEDGLLFSINKNRNGLGFLIVVAGFTTLFLSLLMPLVIWVHVSIRNFLSK